MLTTKHKLSLKGAKREKVEQPKEPERIPRIARMMALAIKLDHLLKTGQVKDQAELARLGHVSRARLTQIMDLNLLATDIQEEPLFETSSVSEHSLRTIVDLNWSEQRQAFQSNRRAS